MAKDKKKKRFTLRKGMPVTDVALPRDEFDDNDREQVLPFAERPEDLCDEVWALPGDDEKPEAELRRLTARKDK